MVASRPCNCEYLGLIDTLSCIIRKWFCFPPTSLLFSLTYFTNTHKPIKMMRNGLRRQTSIKVSNRRLNQRLSARLAPTAQKAISGKATHVSLRPHIDFLNIFVLCYFVASDILSNSHTPLWINLDCNFYGGRTSGLRMRDSLFLSPVTKLR